MLSVCFMYDESDGMTAATMSWLPSEMLATASLEGKQHRVIITWHWWKR